MWPAWDRRAAPEPLELAIRNRSCCSPLPIVSGFITGLEFVMKDGGKPTLVTRDAQHGYVFTAQ